MFLIKIILWRIDQCLIWPGDYDYEHFLVYKHFVEQLAFINRIIDNLTMGMLKRIHFALENTLCG